MKFTFLGRGFGETTLKSGGSKRCLARYRIVMKMQKHGQAAKPSLPMRTNSKERFPPEKLGSSYLRETEKDSRFSEGYPLRRYAPAPPKGEPRSCLPLWGRCPEGAEKVLFSLILKSSEKQTSFRSFSVLTLLRSGQRSAAAPPSAHLSQNEKSSKILFPFHQIFV